MLRKLRLLLRFARWVLDEEDGWLDDIKTIWQLDNRSLQDFIDEDSSYLDASVRQSVNDCLTEIDWSKVIEIEAETKVGVL